ncbi:hypothetical protein CRG98_031477 [Punica granatum]|uniref:Uncharacterized protein n=1 Tax=Punica granatum TaxID=22663 RepID=A0A2I0IVV0_PUNGR|nr:hypothetical protein CRG98_031477 [Punica granatum]
MICGGTVEVGAGTDAETGTGTDVEIGGGMGPKIQVAEDESGKLPDVLVARLQETRVVVAHA